MAVEGEKLKLVPLGRERLISELIDELVCLFRVCWEEEQVVYRRKGKKGQG